MFTEGCLLIFLVFTELQYGIVTNPTVATAIGLPNAPSIVMYSTTHGIHQYIGTFDRAKFRNWTLLQSCEQVAMEWSVGWIICYSVCNH